MSDETETVAGQDMLGRDARRIWREATRSGGSSDQSVTRVRRDDKRRKDVTYVSNGDTAELREYQRMASKYPPLRHEQIVACAREFVKGRDAGVWLLIREEASRMSGSGMTPREIADAIAAEYADDRDSPRDIRNMIGELLDGDAGASNVERSLSLTEGDVSDMRTSKALGDAALSVIVRHNLQLAMSRVGRMMRNGNRTRHVSVEDLICAANVGLVQGARLYDPESGRKFSTYVTWQIDGQLFDITNREDGNSGIQSQTPHDSKQIATISTVTNNFEHRYGRLPTIIELQSLTGMTAKRIEQRKATPQVVVDAIDSPIRSDSSGDDVGQTLGDHISSGMLVEDEIKSERKQDMGVLLLDTIEGMTPEQQDIIRLRYGVGGMGARGESQRVIANRLGMSVRDVERYERDALGRIKDELRKNGYASEDLK